MAVDLKKMYGPLPLGAWLVVVSVGLGIAYWNWRNNAPEPLTEPIDDTSGAPGVGTGAVGGWVPTTPPATGDDTVGGAITTNDEWGRQAINFLIANNYPAQLSDSAIRKYLTNVKLSVQEYALIGIALTKFGSPPQPLPPDENPPPTIPADNAPSAPILRLHHVRATSVGLQWNAVAGAVGYRVYCSDGSSRWSVLTTYTYGSRKANTSYTFWVRAQTLTGKQSPDSNRLTVRTTR